MTMVGGLAVYNMSCTPGYLNNEQGEGDMKAARNSPYMGSMLDYARLLERVASGRRPRRRRGLEGLSRRRISVLVVDLHARSVQIHNQLGMSVGAGQSSRADQVRSG